MRFFTKLYKSNITLILSMILGIYVGINHKIFAQDFSVVGEIYLNMLMVSVIPIVIFSLLLAVYHIKKSSSTLIFRASVICFLVVTIGLACVVSLALIIEPWAYVKDITGFNSLFTGLSYTQHSEMDITDKFDDGDKAGLIALVLRAIPSNLFNSVNTGNMLQIVVGSFILGYGLFSISDKKNKTESLKTNLEFGLEVFMKINEAFISLMPIGVFFLMLSQFLNIDFKALSTLSTLTMVITGSIILQIIVYIFIIKIRSRESLSHVLKVFSETFMLIVTTRSSIVALPKAMEAMGNLKFSKSIIDVYLPFGISIVRIGTMSFFAIVTLFIMGIFEVEITISSSLFIVFACTLASISTIGTSGIISLQMISIVLNPLGLPLGGVLAILIVVDAVVDVFDTFANVIGNCAIAALADERCE